ncbi:arginase family protein [Halalkalicoccus jeotgali]|uniref:Agmatinase n=1 Tax=Halalkalicoccus jeotgali (strain DSM 18796 / CECT 7217 / JCM 14584 / KCTC 4019 / B3) TaxID=795797 RepID=D8J6J7_HALJB|nr:arginase family protein [Halalkalicoccus jeotgali]ADJ13874.1 agmatinase [Halalkalicoccus jeotgali B3]ELY34079.1 agmatinase [Halalkalicoccus jeotgali B3]
MGKCIYNDGLRASKNYYVDRPRGFWSGPDTYEERCEAGMKWYTAIEAAKYDLSQIITDAIKRAIDGTDAGCDFFDIDTMKPAYWSSTGELEPSGLVPTRR